MNRLNLLKQAIALTGGVRNKEYGTPEDNLSNIAILWDAYFEAKYGALTVGQNRPMITAEDVAWLNVLQKMARTFIGSPKPDTYIDAAAYSAIAGECADGETD